MKSNRELLYKALDILHTLEDRTNYDNVKLGTAINLLQDLLPTINRERIADETIEVGVYYYLDDAGNKVYDFDEMMNEFEAELKKLSK
jgi:hypothetical protein